MHGASGAVGESGLGTCPVGKCGMSALRAKCVGMPVLVAGSGKCAAPMVGVVRPCAIQHPHLVAATTDLRGGTGVMARDGSGEEGGQSGGGGERGEVKVGSQLDLMRGHRHPPRV